MITNEKIIQTIIIDIQNTDPPTLKRKLYTGKLRYFQEKWLCMPQNRKNDHDRCNTDDFVHFSHFFRWENPWYLIKVVPNLNTFNPATLHYIKSR